MSQSAIESLFGEDPFFEDTTYLLWPRRSTAVDSFKEHFLQRRAQLLERFREDIQDRLARELGEGFHGSLFQGLDSLCPPSFSRSRALSTEQTRGRAVAVTLDTQGFSPEDITVTVSGRRLEVMAASDSCSSKPAGFVQGVDLPEHIDPASLTCTQGEDGLLRIQSETKQSPSEERLVPIRFRTSVDIPLTKDNTHKQEESTT